MRKRKPSSSIEIPSTSGPKISSAGSVKNRFMVLRVVRVGSVKEDDLAAWAVVIHIWRVAPHRASPIPMPGEYPFELVAAAPSLKYPTAAVCRHGLLHLVVPGFAGQHQVKQVLICSEHPFARLLLFRGEDHAVGLFSGLSRLEIDHI